MRQLLPARVLARAFSSKARRAVPADGRSLADFVNQDHGETPAVGGVEEIVEADTGAEGLLRLQHENRTFSIETYGCQMNVADSEVVRAVMGGAGYQWTETTEAADVVFLNTCAIRDNAEQRIWGRLGALRGLRRKEPGRERVVGVLGCMAERLKSKLLEEEAVDLVAGPDAYRDLPRLLNLVAGGEKGFNVQLSHEETYADVKPVRIHPDQKSAFVSIMRGCNNMCSYCIVPFTRGRERSRPVASVVEEVRRLSGQGVKEVVLLGQNVNSYHDRSGQEGQSSSQGYEAAEGFSNMFRSRDGPGPRFADLLDQVSQVDPDMRIRFTSPHPKDFPPLLLQLIAERPNLCNALHLPAQSGSSTVLDRMRRGYTREAYLSLVERARSLIPGVALSSDFISGFCGETDEEHADTVSLLAAVAFEQAFMFAYSKRDKTHAAYKMQDDVPPEVKQRRLEEVIATFRREIDLKNRATEPGRQHLVLIEGRSKRWTPENPTLTGRSDTNKRVIIPEVPVPMALGASELVSLKAGDYVGVRIASAHVQTLQAVPIARSSIVDFERWGTVERGFELRGAEGQMRQAAQA